MLRNEDIKKIDELKTNFTHRWFEVDYILKLIDIFKFSNLLKSFSHFKKQGYGFKEVLLILLTLPFIGITNINLMQDKKFKAKKDVFYRLKNNPLIDWRSILWLFVMRFVNIVNAKASDNAKVKCLIIDDSFLEKTGSVKSSILLSYQALIILPIASLKNLTVAMAMLKFFALLSTKLSSTYTT